MAQLGRLYSIASLVNRLGRYRNRILLLLSLLLSFAVILLVTDYSYRNSLSLLERDSHFKLNLYKKVVLSELKRHAYLPLTLSKDKQILEFLQQSSDPEKGQALNGYLESLSEGTDALNIYLMDPTGTTIATSNWNQQTSYLGHNYRFRPYFKNALAGRPSIFFAIGATTRIPGLFLSHPVYKSDRVDGVVVIKVSMQPLELLWAEQGNEKVFLTDANGIIFSSNEPRWVFHSLTPLSQRQQESLKADRKYLDQPIQLLPIHTWNQGGDTRLVEIGSDSNRALGYLQQSQALPNTPWRLHILTSSLAARQAAINAFFLSLLVLIILGLVLYVLFKRRRVAERLKQAHDQLEKRVTERTAELTQRSIELSESNVQLKHEIKERQRAHEALRRTQDDLIQASKLAALGQMSAGITHELNQPLAAIRTFSSNGEKLLERNQEEAALGNFRRIFNLTGRMGDIINHLKTFARKSQNRKEPVLLVDCLKQALDLISHLAERDQVQILFERPKKALWVRGDPVRLEQVFINLFSNAIQALSSQPNKQIRICFILAENHVTVSIRDNGPGIEESILESIFDPFFTTKEVGEGMGLGLSIVYGIMMEHGGTIQARNREGAEILVGLPLLSDIPADCEDRDHSAYRAEFGHEQHG